MFRIKIAIITILFFGSFYSVNAQFEIGNVVYFNDVNVVNNVGGDMYFSGGTSTLNGVKVTAIEFYVAETSGLNFEQYFFNGTNEANTIDCGTGEYTISNDNWSNGFKKVKIPVSGEDCVLGSNIGGINELYAGDKSLGGDDLETPAFYLKIYGEGESIIFNTDEFYNTKFTDLDVSSDNSSGSTTLTITPSFFIDVSEVSTNTPTRNITQIKASISKTPGTEIIGRGVNLPDLQTTSVDIEFFDVADGSYTLLVQFWNASASFDSTNTPFPKSYIYADVLIENGTVVDITGISFTSGVKEEQSIYKDCGIYKIDNCIYNAFAGLFIPSETSLENFGELNNSLASKFPFAYAYDLSGAMTTMYNSSTTETLMLQVPFGTATMTLISADMVENFYYASLLKSLIAGGLWILFCVIVYRRTIRIFDNTTQSV